MDIDVTTYNDLSLFQSEEEFSVFHKLNFTRTSSGKFWLQRLFNHPFSSAEKIFETQEIIRLMGKKLKEWPAQITNGTVMVMERLYESNIDTIPGRASRLDALMYRTLHAPDFSLLRYSIGHFADFFRGMAQLLALLQEDEVPAQLAKHLSRAQSLMSQPLSQKLSVSDPAKAISVHETVMYGHFILYSFRHQAKELIDIYGRLDAWYSMAMAMHKLHLSFPVITNEEHPHVEAQDLYHLLLANPVSYDVSFTEQCNFLFLTGANMAGKSTFIKAIGIAVFLAHLGMGVPAASMKLGLFDGILSNINVADNIAKGESYFYNEVQRVKNTILKINNGKKWLVLIDELFKGTNVQDAMKCSLAVIRGLTKIKKSLFILSTHLYEIGEELKSYPNISFKYFETSVLEDQLSFSYQLKDGISNDRLGYVILKREKVVDLLDQL